MNDNENRRHQMFVRVDDFGQGHASDFAPASLARQHFTDLGTVIGELDAHAAAETSGRGEARQATESRAQARAELRENLEAINRTARAMAAEVPGIDDKFRLPRGNNDQQLLHAARAFREDAQPLEAQFIAHEMPADFLADLQADINALANAISQQGSGVGSHVAAGAAIDDTISRGNELVRKLDAIMRNKYANNPAVLAQWTSASHTERAPRRAAAAGGGNTPPAQGSTPPPSA